MRHVFAIFAVLAIAGLLTGCEQIVGPDTPNGDGQEDEETGAIAFEMEGLSPASSYRGAVAVRLDGPGYTEELAPADLTSEVRELPPGEYTVRFESVREIGEVVDTIHEPELSEQMVTVTAGETSTLNVRYARRPGSGMLWATVSSVDDEVLLGLDASDLSATGAPEPSIEFDMTEIQDSSKPGYTPTGIAVGAEGSLWIVHYWMGAVEQFTAEQLVAATATPTPALRLLLENNYSDDVGLEAIAFDASGDLYVTDRHGWQVLRYDGLGERVGDAADPTTETLSADLEVADWDCGYTDRDCGENYEYRVDPPYGIAVDENGSVWFGNAGLVTLGGSLVSSGWVTRYTADSLDATGSQWDTPVDGWIEAAADPLNLAFDADGGLWIANAHENDYSGDVSELHIGRIYHYDDPDTAAANTTQNSVQNADLSVVLSDGDSEVYPGAMAFDNSGYLWIYDLNTASLGRYEVASLDGSSTTLQPEIVISGAAPTNSDAYLAFNPPPPGYPIHVPGQ